MGLGIFAVAVLAVAAVLILGGDDEPDKAASILSDATATRTLASNAPTATSAPSPSPTSLTSSSSATATPGLQAAATGEPSGETSTPEPAPELPEETATPGGAEGEPTLEPTVNGEPTAEPASGDFGTLPPADVPSGGLGRDLVLEYDLAISELDLPSEATVYHMLWTEYTPESAAALAAALGVDGDVTGGDGSFQVEGADGSLAISGQSIQYSYGGKVPAVSLEDDATLLSAARDWLLTSGLVLNDLGSGVVIGRDELGARVSVVFYSTDPETLLSVYPSARMTIGPGSTVLEAYVIWPSGYESSVYGLRSLDDLLGDLYDGRAFVEADLSQAPGDGQLLGTLTITSTSIAYSTAGSSGTGQFLTPVVVFSGEAVLSDSGQTISVSVYVPAVFAQDAPRG